MKILLLLATLLLNSCSGITTMIGDKILVRFGADMDKTIELARKYESSSVLQCAEFLKIATDGVEELRAEKTDGFLFASAFKAALLRRLGTVFEDKFAEECGGVAAHILVELGRKAPIPGR